MKIHRDTITVDFRDCKTADEKEHRMIYLADLALKKTGLLPSMHYFEGMGYSVDSARAEWGQIFLIELA